MDQLVKTILDVVLAVATAVLAVFTVRLYRATQGLLDEAKRQYPDFLRNVQASVESAGAAKASAAALTSTERPWLFVQIDPAFGNDAFGTYVSYAVESHGKLPAIVENPMHVVSTNPGGPPAPLRADDNFDLIESPVIGTHDRRPNLKCRPPGNASSSSLVAQAQGLDEGDLYVVVEIHYRGPFTKNHMSRAIRRFDFATMRFVKCGDDEFT